MRKYIYIIILIVVFCFIKVPEYKELNNIHVIDKITIYCDRTVYREVIPIRSDNGINYKYKNYNNINNNYYTKKAKVINKCE